MRGKRYSTRVLMFRSATAQTLPPLPPPPPSGPPRGTFFSRRKLTAPSPPLPEWISMHASSTNFIAPVETKKPYRVDRAFGEEQLASRPEPHLPFVSGPGP